MTAAAPFDATPATESIMVPFPDYVPASSPPHLWSLHPGAMLQQQRCTTARTLCASSAAQICQAIPIPLSFPVLHHSICFLALQSRCFPTGRDQAQGWWGLSAVTLGAATLLVHACAGSRALPPPLSGWQPEIRLAHGSFLSPSPRRMESEPHQCPRQHRAATSQR